MLNIIKLTAIPAFTKNKTTGEYEYPDSYISNALDKKNIKLYELDGNIVFFDTHKMHNIADPIVSSILMGVMSKLKESEINLKEQTTITDVAKSEIQNLSNNYKTILGEYKVLQAKLNKNEESLDSCLRTIKSIDEHIKLVDDNPQQEIDIPEIKKDIISETKNLIRIGLSNFKKLEKVPPPVNSNFEQVEKLTRDFVNFKNEAVDMITSLGSYQEETYSVLTKLKTKLESSDSPPGSISESTLLHLVRMITKEENPESDTIEVITNQTTETKL